MRIPFALATALTFALCAPAGAVTWGPFKPAPTGGQIGGAAVGDVTQTTGGNSDALVSHPALDRVALVPAAYEGYLEAPLYYRTEPGFAPGPVDVVDYDGNGRRDFMALSTAGPNRVAIWYQSSFAFDQFDRVDLTLPAEFQGIGAPTAIAGARGRMLLGIGGRTIAITGNDAAGAQYVEAAGDPIVDIQMGTIDSAVDDLEDAAVLRSGGRVTPYLASGGNAYRVGASSETGPGALALALGTLGADPDRDVVVGGSAPVTTTLVSHWGPQGAYLTQSGQTEGSARSLDAADVDANGTADLLRIDAGTGRLHTHVTRSADGGSWTPAAGIDLPMESPRWAFITNVDNVGGLDVIAVASDAAGTVAVGLNENRGEPGFSPSYLEFRGTTGQRVEATVKLTNATGFPAPLRFIVEGPNPSSVELTPIGCQPGAVSPFGCQLRVAFPLVQGRWAYTVRIEGTDSTLLISQEGRPAPAVLGFRNADGTPLSVIPAIALGSTWEGSLDLRNDVERPTSFRVTGPGYEHLGSSCPVGLQVPGQTCRLYFRVTASELGNLRIAAADGESWDVRDPTRAAPNTDVALPSSTYPQLNGRPPAGRRAYTAECRLPRARARASQAGRLVQPPAIYGATGIAADTPSPFNAIFDDGRRRVLSVRVDGRPLGCKDAPWLVSGRREFRFVHILSNQSARTLRVDRRPRVTGSRYRLTWTDCVPGLRLAPRGGACGVEVAYAYDRFSRTDTIRDDAGALIVEVGGRETHAQLRQHTRRVNCAGGAPTLSALQARIAAGTFPVLNLDAERARGLFGCADIPSDLRTRALRRKPVPAAIVGRALRASKAGRVRVRVRCSNGRSRCTAPLRLYASGLKGQIAKTVRLRVPARGSRTVTVRLTRSALRQLRARKRLSVGALNARRLPVTLRRR